MDDMEQKLAALRQKVNSFTPDERFAKTDQSLRNILQTLEETHQLQTKTKPNMGNLDNEIAKLRESFDAGCDRLEATMLKAFRESAVNAFDPVPELLKLLSDAANVISMYYDSSKDNRRDPPMQKTGKVLKQINKILDLHRKAGA